MVYRYLILEAENPDKAFEKLKKAVLELWGISGLAITGLKQISVYSEKNAVIVRVEREGLHMLRAAIAASSEPVARVVKVTGSCRKAKRIAESLPSQRQDFKHVNPR